MPSGAGRVKKERLCTLPEAAQLPHRESVKDQPKQYTDQVGRAGLEPRDQRIMSPFFGGGTTRRNDLAIRHILPATQQIWPLPVLSRYGPGCGYKSPSVAGVTPG